MTRHKSADADRMSSAINAPEMDHSVIAPEVDHLVAALEYHGDDIAPEVSNSP